MAITKMTKKDSQFQATPSIAQPATPKIILNTNRGFLNPRWSANVPQMGPMTATRMVATDPA